jgi:plastocyanin
VTRARRIRVRLLALLALATAVTAVAMLVRDARAGSPSGVAVGVAEREFHITPYRRSVPPGRVRFNVTNYGEDTHNLVVRGPRGYRAASPDVRAGERFTLATTLRRTGTYRLLCTKADHVALGMTSRIVVRRPRRR